MKGKPLTELYVHGRFTEDREEWNQELQRHCEEVYSDPEETKGGARGKIRISRGNGPAIHEGWARC